MTVGHASTAHVEVVEHLAGAPVRPARRSRVPAYKTRRGGIGICRRATRAGQLGDGPCRCLAGRRQMKVNVVSA